MRERVGRYHVLSPLGEGGHAVVYRARGPRGDVAVKVLSTQTKETIARLRRETRTHTRLRHPGIVSVLDYIERQGEVALVLELIPFPTLDAWLAQHPGPLDIDRACALFCHLVRAVAYVHRHGLVHRDIKPPNIFVVQTPEGPALKLGDFGIVRETEDEVGAGMLGTFGYQPLEQMRDASQADHRADLFSLGVVLYEMLCGKPPFEGDFYAICRSMMGNDFEPPSAHRPDLPEDLDALICQLLSNDPGKRPAGAEAVLERLQARPGVVSQLPAAAHLEQQIRAAIADPHYVTPVIPESASELQRMCADDTIPFSRIVPVLERDPVLAGQVMRRARSPVYGRREVKSLREAATRLGVFALRDLAWEVAVRSVFEVSRPYRRAVVGAARHCSEVGHLTKLVCELCDLDQGLAFVIGLMHDVGLAGGLAILSERHPDEAPTNTTWRALDSVHEALGFELAIAWGIETELARIIGNHHVVALADSHPPLQAAVLLADHLSERVGTRLPEIHDSTDGGVEAARKLLGLRISMDDLSDLAAHRLAAVRQSEVSLAA